jgi:hypothetical protein
LVIGRDHGGLQLDVRTQVEAVGDVVEVAQDLRLGGVPFGPLPLLLQVLGEGVGVLHALHVAARARVPVPVPGAADTVTRLEDADGEVRAPQPVQHVQAGETGPDYYGVEVVRASFIHTGYSTRNSYE